MNPAIIQGTFVTVFVKERDLDEIEQGDIVGYEYFGLDKSHPDQNFYVGRVIAKEGKRVEIRAGDIYINGERYVDNIPNDYRTIETIEPILVPKDHLYILSDYRKYGPKADSRAIGPIHKDAILGKVKKGLPFF